VWHWLGKVLADEHAYASSMKTTSNYTKHMGEDILLGQIRTMLKFLGKERIVVPHYQLPLPERCVGNWRNNQIFFLYGTTGKLSYKGWGHQSQKDVQIEGIEPSKLWLDAAHWSCSNECVAKVRSMTLNSCMPHSREYVYRFNGMKWLV
jgi:hypothetical protein